MFYIFFISHPIASFFFLNRLYFMHLHYCNFSWFLCRFNIGINTKYTKLFDVLEYNLECILKYRKMKILFKTYRYLSLIKELAPISTSRHLLILKSVLHGKYIWIWFELTNKWKSDTQGCWRQIYQDTGCGYCEFLGNADIVEKFVELLEIWSVEDRFKTRLFVGLRNTMQRWFFISYFTFKILMRIVNILLN